MKDQEFLTLVTRHLSGETSASETNRLHQLLQERENRKMFDFIKHQWENATQETDLTKFSHAKGYQMLVNKIKQQEPTFAPTKPKEAEVIPLYRKLVRVAAAVILLSVAFYVVYTATKKIPTEPAFVVQEKVTQPGQRANFTLADQSTITVNGESALTFKEPFQDNLREFSLNGEAYFNVARNPKAPFIVNFKDLQVEVLGTAFNVEARSAENTSYISLVEGSIKVLNDKGNVIKILKPGEQLVYNHQTQELTVQVFDLLKTVGWKDNVLVFDNEKLADVLPELQQQYGATFEVSDPTLLNCIIKADFQDETLYGVLEALKFAGDLKYEIGEDNQITLHGEGCP
ncbi:MAG: FecR domain-containing protein [Bacteroidota bacterium]